MNGTDPMEIANGGDGGESDHDRLDRIAIAVRTLCDGGTPWQSTVDRRFKVLSNQVLILMGSRIAWPGAALLAALFLGGFAGELVYRLVTR